ncbi:type II toxin-antitoxin system Phd/YefM family antitoxin [Treponema denticola]|uniref:type II toxin-antitoxin system Phd/YefM family antitoxin n=1 Tax=Treponema denticola TaxID=158 RepID=UPI00220D9DDA|nr:type II toxin-antitoxin system Phd/YefM family antitoxin [Treponema denticola]
MFMPQILPIRDLKNTSAISNLCHKTNEPIFITKNGYGDMVIMSMETYEGNAFLNNLYGNLEEAEMDLQNGRVSGIDEAIEEIKSRYDL